MGGKPSVETSSDLKLNRIKNLQWEVVQSGNNSDQETDGPFQNTLFNGVAQELKLKLKLLLNNTTSVYETNCSTTALHTACKNGNLDAVRLLLKSGAPVNARDESGATPLHLMSVVTSQNTTTGKHLFRLIQWVTLLMVADILQFNYFR